MNMINLNRFVVVVVLCALFICAKAVTEEEGKEMIKGMTKECQEQEGATPEDVDNMLNKIKPSTKEAKCFTACVMEQFGVMDTGKFSQEGFVELSKMVADGNEDAIKTAEEIGESCKVVEDEDRCDLAFKIIECMEAEATKRGLNE